MAFRIPLSQYSHDQQRKALASLSYMELAKKCQKKNITVGSKYYEKKPLINALMNQWEQSYHAGTLSQSSPKKQSTKCDTQVINQQRFTDNNAIRKCTNEIDDFKTDCTDYVECNDINKAKLLLKKGHSVRYQLHQNIKSSELVNITKQFGLNTVKLEKILTSGAIIKEVLNNYINSNHDGYLAYCTQLTALRPTNKYKYMAQTQIRMNLDYNKYVKHDDQFKKKFIDELSKNVFKCPSNNIKLVDVRAGSVVVIVAVCILAIAAIAIGAVIGAVIYLSNKRSNLHEGENREFKLNEQVTIKKQGVEYSAIVIGLSSYNKITVKYTKNKPWWQFCSTETFSNNDKRVIQSEPVIDQEIRATIQIGGGYIELSNI